MDAGDGVVEGCIAHVALQRRDPGHAGRRNAVAVTGNDGCQAAVTGIGRFALRQPRLRLRRVEPLQLAKQQGAQSSPCSPRRHRLYARETHTEFVVGQQHGMQAVTRGVFHFAKRVRKHIGLVASHLAHEPGIQTRPAGRIRAVVQQRERGQRGFT